MTKFVNKIGNYILRIFLENRFVSRWFVLTIDMVLACIAIVCSFSITQQMYKGLNVMFHPLFWDYAFLMFFSSLFCFLLFRTYQGIIRYSTVQEFQKIFFALTVSHTFVFFWMYKILRLSGSVSIAYCFISFLFMAISLLGFRIFVVYTYQIIVNSFGKKIFIPVFIWGVDDQNLPPSQRLRSSQKQFKVRGFLTNDNKNKIKRRNNLPVVVLDSPEDLVNCGIKNVLFTSDNALKDNAEFVEKMLSLNIHIFTTELKNIERVDSLEVPAQKKNRIRPIQIEDILGRPEIDISFEGIAHDVQNKVVLVTGAAGSIGSEIVRQLAAFETAHVICFDQAETPLNELDLELKKEFPKLNFTVIIGSVCDESRMKDLFNQYKPNVVYHAAAYKHVPLMENNPCEAIKVNVSGSRLVVDLCVEYNIDMFVMVSTDKAVNPTNIMGASKRIAEIYVQSLALNSPSKTKFVTTRFGNVLGSNGSVIPLFRKQIERGGPITVTDPNITRYFMTIPEACKLVLEASHIGESGHIYVFDMGAPVKIYDMAVRMIELAGLVPGKDINIEFTGLRPGEKLYEEVLNNEETTVPTVHKKVLIAKVREYNIFEILPAIANVVTLAQEGLSYEMVSAMKQLVPEFVSNNSEFETLDNKKENRTV